MSELKIRVPMFKGVNIFGETVRGQLLVIDDIACIIPLNESLDGNRYKDYMKFDGHHIDQVYDSALWIRDPSTIQADGFEEVEVC